MKKETIAAIATATSSAGIGIVRISGDEALEIINRVFRSKNNKKTVEWQSHTIHYGYIYDGEEPVDEVLVMYMKGPRSYTGENTIEIDCHGGAYVVRKILETIIRYGARPAEPGEFTKRAFLNGRIDLSQAEAVADVISSRNQYALKNSISQLNGSIKKKISDIRNELIYNIAFIESAIDDPEHYSVDGYGGKLEEIVDKIFLELEWLLKKADDGRIMKEGIQTVIVGKPNAGKSSLLNLLAGRERAIVTDVAGTTRDILEEYINLDGISLNLIDTAGIHDTSDIVEKIGVSRAKEYANDADLILYVVDSSTPLDSDDNEIINLIKNRPVIILLNKIDLDQLVKRESLKFQIDCPIIEISVKNETGIIELESMLKKMFLNGDLAFNDEIYITNVRQKDEVSQAMNSLRNVKLSIQDELPEDFYSIDLMDAYEALGKITGETIGEDLVNEIFSKFCMGK